MKVLRFTTLLILSLLLTACAGGALTRMGVERIESFRVERIGLGSTEGIATVALYNGNKKNVIFDSGRIDVVLNGRTLGVVTLQQSVVAHIGMQRVEFPVRIRFARDGMKSMAELLFPKREQRRDKAEWRMVGTLTVIAGNNGPLHEQTVRFNRKITEKTTGRLGDTNSWLLDLIP